MVKKSDWPGPHRTGLYRKAARRLVVAAALPLALLAIAGCGGGDGGSAAGASGTSAASEAAGTSGGAGMSGGATIEGGGEGGSGAPRSGAAPRACRARTAALLGALDTLRDRLVAGLDYRRYVGLMRGARAAYRALPVGRLGVECLTAVGGPAEAALNHYIEALNTWAGCVEVPGCQSTSIEARLQRRWRLASRALSEAERALSR